MSPSLNTRSESLPELQDGGLTYKGKVYFTLREATTKYHVSGKFLKDALNHVVSELGRKIRAISIPVHEKSVKPSVDRPGYRGKRRELTLYAEKDLEKIKAKRQLEASGDGWPKTTTEVLKLGSTEDELKKYVRENGKGTWRDKRQAAEGGNVTVVRLWTEKAHENVVAARTREVPATRWEKLTDKEAREPPFGFAATTLANWGNKGDCPYLPGRQLRRKKINGIWYNDKKELEEILRSKNTPRNAPHVDAEGVWWPSGALIFKRWRIGDGQVWNWANDTKYGCPFLGRTVRVQEIERPHPKIPGGTLLVYHEWDVQTAVENRSKGIRPKVPVPLFVQPTTAGKTRSTASNGQVGKFRHPDHRFEWTRQEFQGWATGIASRFGYEVRFLPVGPEHPDYGPPTHMAVFQQV